MGSYTSPPTPDPAPPIRRVTVGFEVEDDGSPGTFYKEDDSLWLRNADGTEVQLGSGNGGSSASVEGGVYFLAATAVPANTSTFFSWAFAYGTPHLDLADPQHPAVQAEAVYALTVTIVGPNSYTAGTKIACGIDIDTENNDAGASVYGVLSTTVAGGNITFPCGITFFSPLGHTLLAQVAHDDVVNGTLDFTATAYVQPT